MIVYALEQSWEILRQYFENHGNVAECVVTILYEFWKNRSTASIVCSISCEKTGILSDKPKREKPKTVRTPDNIAAVAEKVREAPSTTLQRRSQQLNISVTSLRRILHLGYDVKQSPIGSGLEAN